MAESPLSARVLEGARVKVMSDDARLLVRAAEDVDELLRLRAVLRAKTAGRGRWLLWTWLLVLGGSTVTVEGADATVGLVLIPLMVIGLILIVSYVVRVRDRANNAEDWLSEIDFRLAQLAARPER